MDTTLRVVDVENHLHIEVRRHHGGWSRAESVWVLAEDIDIKRYAFEARLAWYRETHPEFTYRLVQTQVVTGAAVLA